MKGFLIPWKDHVLTRLCDLNDAIPRVKREAKIKREKKWLATVRCKMGEYILRSLINPKPMTGTVLSKTPLVLTSQITGQLRLCGP